MTTTEWVTGLLFWCAMYTLLGLLARDAARAAIRAKQRRR